MIITDFTVLFVLWKLSCHIYFITVTFHLHKNHNLFIPLVYENLWKLRSISCTQCRSCPAVPATRFRSSFGTRCRKHRLTRRPLFSACPRLYPGYLRFFLPQMKHRLQASQPCQSNRHFLTARSLLHKILITSFYKNFSSAPEKH